MNNMNNDLVSKRMSAFLGVLYPIIIAEVIPKLEPIAIGFITNYPQWAWTFILLLVGCLGAIVMIRKL